MLNRKMKPIAAAVGTVFIASLATAVTASAESPLFAADELDVGYDQLAQGDAEGKCGEGKCGEDKDAKDEGEGKCGEDKEKDEGEGKCGEGKCGEDKDES